MRPALLIALSLCLLAGPTHITQAYAQGSRVSYLDRQRAKKLFGEARKLYRRGDYESAVEKWKESFELSKEPLIFESIASAYERMGDSRNALDYLSRWRKHAPAAEHTLLNARLTKLKERVDKLDEQARQERLAREAEEEARQKQKEAGLLNAEKSKREAADKSADVTRNRTIGFAVAGTGAAAVIAGSIVSGIGLSRRPNESEACASNPQGGLLCQQSFSQDIQSSNTLTVAGDATWIAGAVLVGAGTTWLLINGEWFEPPTDTSGATKLSPLVSPTFAGLSWTASF